MDFKTAMKLFSRGKCQEFIRKKSNANDTATRDSKVKHGIYLQRVLQLEAILKESALSTVPHISISQKESIVLMADGESGGLMVDMISWFQEDLMDDALGTRFFTMPNE